MYAGISSLFLCRIRHILVLSCLEVRALRSLVWVYFVFYTVLSLGTILINYFCFAYFCLAYIVSFVFIIFILTIVIVCCELFICVYWTFLAITVNHVHFLYNSKKSRRARKQNISQEHMAQRLIQWLDLKRCEFNIWLEPSEQLEE